MYLNAVRKGFTFVYQVAPKIPQTWFINLGLSQNCYGFSLGTQQGHHYHNIDKIAKPRPAEETGKSGEYSGCSPAQPSTHPKERTTAGETHQAGK